MSMNRSVLICVVALHTAANAWAATEINDYLSLDWYATEVIIFQRAQVAEFNTTERLLLHSTGSFPAGMRTLNAVPEQMIMGDHLDPHTRATLEFPTVTVRRPIIVDDDEPLESPRPWPNGTAPPAINPLLEPHPLLDFMARVRRFDDHLETKSHQWLPAHELIMAAEARRLNNRYGHQLLFHGRWLQPVPPREEPQPVLIQAGSDLGDRYQLEGTIDTTLGRFLHFHAQLSYREPAFGQQPIYLPVAADGSAFDPPLPAETPTFMILNESRRMRSEETHYLDHPKLGIIVRIDPVAFPEDLVADFDALDEPVD